MGYRDPTYVVFDGDDDKWAYAYMKGWKKNDNIDFDFRDAHDLDTMTGRAQEEAYVKKHLRERMEKSAAVMVLVGKNTKRLYKYVRWELELALELGLPIIVVNLNDERAIDKELCPVILRDAVAMHIPFKLAIIKHTLDSWPSRFRSLSIAEWKEGPRHYLTSVYSSLGL